jgi:hypothetical protein
MASRKESTGATTAPGQTSGFAALPADQLPVLKEWFAGQLAGAASVTDAATRFVSALADRFSSVILARVYGTVPYGKLPEPEQRFAARLAESHGRTSLTADTPTLVLLGSRGRKQEWNDRLASQDHLAIPLLSKEFVGGIPMLASLLREIGLNLDWLDSPGEALTRPLMGGFNGVFFVPSARLGRDGQGRQVIPAQDFVAAHDVQSVFGMGGSYPWGGFVTAIIFTNETLSRASAERYAPLVSVFKSASSLLVADGKIFSA